MECRTAPDDHLVAFYDERQQLIDRVVTFAVDGLRAGEYVLLVGTPDHLADIERGIAATGADSARLSSFDAATALARFQHNGTIDRAAFDATIGDLVRTTAAKGTVRIFGEMVALLWADGGVREAIEIEALWCDLRDTCEFTLLCAYPSALTIDADLQGPVRTVCELHGEIHIGDDGSAVSMRVYPATPQAVREARHFVRACIGHDGRTVDDVLLVTSELCSNAVHHTGGVFAVSVALSADRLRVGVCDSSALTPRLLPMAGNAAESGRGIATIAALSTRWGIERHAVGKTVWAELPLSR